MPVPQAALCALDREHAPQIAVTLGPHHRFQKPYAWNLPSAFSQHSESIVNFNISSHPEPKRKRINVVGPHILQGTLQHWQSFTEHREEVVDIVR